jgi:hypothetical protein
LFLRSNGWQLSCHAEYYQIVPNETSSRRIFPFAQDLYAQCKMYQRPFGQLELLVRLILQLVNFTKNKIQNFATTLSL